ncbi:hypothetical protein ACO0SA_002420 [Hanseniaspora valbyensis]
MTLIKEKNNSIDYLRSIGSVRDTTSEIFNYIKANGKGKYFSLNLEKMPDVAEFVVEKIIKPDYPTTNDLAKIPPHGRWQHLDCLNINRMEKLIQTWKQDPTVDEIEICRRIIDLFVFSVLIDAGAGNTWKYFESETNLKIGRSEGLAVASYYMFVKGQLSNDSKNDPYKVHGERLTKWNLEKDFKPSFQISEENEMTGLEGRLKLVVSLGEALVSNKEIFGEDARPGNIIDYLYKQRLTEYESTTIDLEQVWEALMTGLVTIWPKSRMLVEGQPLGDCWKLDTIPEKPDFIVTFHKLTQWLCYSLLVPMQKYGYKFTILNTDLQTGLPEYRNGGLFYDLDVIQLLPSVYERGVEKTKEIETSPSEVAYEIPTFEPHDGAIVEWRCLTIGLLDYLLPLVNEKLGYELQLAQLIEAGSWKGGRVIAMEKRPKINGGPPINLLSDGTVF